MLMVAVAHFATTKRERELLLRAQRHAIEAAGAGMMLEGGQHAYNDTLPLLHKQQLQLEQQQQQQAAAIQMMQQQQAAATQMMQPQQQQAAATQMMQQNSMRQSAPLPTTSFKIPQNVGNPV